MFAAMIAGAALVSACALLTWGTKNTIGKPDAEAGTLEASADEAGSEAGEDGSPDAVDDADDVADAAGADL